MRAASRLSAQASATNLTAPAQRECAKRQQNDHGIVVAFASQEHHEQRIPEEGNGPGKVSDPDLRRAESEIPAVRNPNLPAITSALLRNLAKT